MKYLDNIPMMGKCPNKSYTKFLLSIFGLFTVQRRKVFLISKKLLEHKISTSQRSEGLRGMFR